MRGEAFRVYVVISVGGFLVKCSNRLAEPKSIKFGSGELEPNLNHKFYKALHDKNKFC